MRDLRPHALVIIVAAASAAVVAALTVLVITGTALPALDRHVLGAANGHRPSALDGITGLVTDVFSPPVDAALLLGAAALLSRRTRSRRPVLLALAALAALGGAVLAMKYGIARPAPPPHRSHDGGVFPSGHTTATLVCYGTAAIIVGPGHRNLRRGLIAVTAGATALVGVALVYGGYHWLSDVVAAIALGLLVLVGVHVARVRTILSEPDRDRGSTCA